MRNRCNNKNRKDYKHYGGRGITYDPRYNDFMNFLNDMKDIYQPGLEIDRIDVNGNYVKENIRFVTRAEQVANTRRTVWLEYQGKKWVAEYLAREHGIHPWTLICRVRSGMSVEEALLTPLNDSKLYNSRRAWLTIDGVTKTRKEWCDEAGISQCCLRHRLKVGMDPKEALSKPSERPKKR